MAESKPHAASPHEAARWTGPMPKCPMAETCRGIVDKPSLRLAMFLPGLVFIGVGVLIILVPQALVWLMAAAFVLFGLVMLSMAGFMRAVAAQIKERSASGSS